MSYYQYYIIISDFLVIFSRPEFLIQEVITHSEKDHNKGNSTIFRGPAFKFWGVTLNKLVTVG